MQSLLVACNRVLNVTADASYKARNPNFSHDAEAYGLTMRTYVIYFVMHALVCTPMTRNTVVT